MPSVPTTPYDYSVFLIVSGAGTTDMDPVNNTNTKSAPMLLVTAGAKHTSTVVAMVMAVAAMATALLQFGIY